MNTNRISAHLDAVNLIGKLADLKESHYQQGLLLNAVIELLIDKGLVTAQELAVRAEALDKEAAISPYTHTSLPEQ